MCIRDRVSTQSTWEVITGNNAVAAPATGIPYEENTLCVNAESYASDYVYVSFASKNDKFTFTGDSQIAHTAAKGSIALKACKGNTTDNIPISAQGSTCGFDYEDELATAGGYCENQDGDTCLLYTSPSPRDLSTSRMPSSA
eukprot:TRINITY_DN14295_c0_g1_i2.p3 TRINITY_DN14295_c0_g1~~TRINITY_DN14295_c0_g1_i2.p3  ORF type:complete len:142 (+),score=32.85 TRINITY_DN14295_c0_g1_i2:121-546(+)